MSTQSYAPDQQATGHQVTSQPTTSQQATGISWQDEPNWCRTLLRQDDRRQIIRRHDAIAASTCAGFSGLDTKMVLWSRGKGAGASRSSRWCWRWWSW